MSLSVGDLCLEDINFRSGTTNIRPVSVYGTRMRLSGACAAGEPLARKEGQYAILARVSIDGSEFGLAVYSLICYSSNIACVVRIWPLIRRSVSMPKERS